MPPILGAISIQDIGILVAIVCSISSLVISLKNRKYSQKMDAITRKTQIRLDLYELIAKLRTRLIVSEKAILEAPEASADAGLPESVALIKTTIGATQKLHGCMTCAYFSDDPVFLEISKGTIQECLRTSSEMLEETNHLIAKLKELERELMDKSAEPLNALDSQKARLL
ncbi:MAG: hypothetical protein FJ106_08085 [Deltaproteobacteria bacterium]|nr:hypothetical protein [Deltaproteobacteria bacterium]